MHRDHCLCEDVEVQAVEDFEDDEAGENQGDHEDHEDHGEQMDVGVDDNVAQLDNLLDTPPYHQIEESMVEVANLMEPVIKIVNNFK